MTVAVMQPYFFPYLGYFQLVNAVDTFVFFDDVNFINKGWINRNQLLNNNQPCRFTVSLSQASQNKKINEIRLADFDSWKAGFLKTVELSYKKAPQFAFVFDWLHNFLSTQFSFIGELASESIVAVAQLLDLNTEFKHSSNLSYLDGSKKTGEQKIIAICKKLRADKYINPINGKSLYDEQNFAADNIQLCFLKMTELNYQQLSKDVFVPNLSIIDVLMFNPVEKIKGLLNEFSLNHT